MRTEDCPVCIGTGMKISVTGTPRRDICVTSECPACRGTGVVQK